MTVLVAGSSGRQQVGNATTAQWSATTQWSAKAGWCWQSRGSVSSCFVGA